MANRREDFEQALSDFFKGYLDHEAIIEALRIAAEQGGERQRVRHKKRGSTYQVVGVAELQVALPPDPAEGALLVIYQSEHDGKLWARRDTEFNDGRFEHLPRADHSTATPVSGWRSMDSTPRDGTWVLLGGCDYGYEQVVARWSFWENINEHDWGDYVSRGFSPKVWQPLPSPPGGGA